jgi:flagellar motor protein MotB
MRKMSRLVFVSGLLAIMIGCVSEKSFDEVMRQLERARSENDGLRRQLDQLKEEYSGFAQEKVTLEREAAENKIRVVELLAEVQSQTQQIKDLSKGKRVVTKTVTKIQKPDMSWVEGITESLNKSFKGEIEKGSVQIHQSEDRLVIRVTDLLIFEEDDLDISPDGEDTLARLGEILKMAKGHPIMIGGHLDNTPIAPALAPEFPTAWEFTGTRATEAVRFLQEESKISGENLSAVAYGLTRPVASNTTETGRAQNRRMEFTLFP